MRKFSIFTIGIIAIFGVAVATPKPAEAGGRYHRGGDGAAAIAGIIAGIAIGAMLTKKKRHHHVVPASPPAYRHRPAARPRAYHSGGYRPSPYALKYNPYTANRRYPGSYAQRRQCHTVYGVKRIGAIDHLVENQVCR